MIVNKLFSHFKFTRNQKLFWLLCLCFVYPCCLTAWYKPKLHSEVVFIILILSPTTVYMNIHLQRRSRSHHLIFMFVWTPCSIFLCLLGHPIVILMFIGTPCIILFCFLGHPVLYSSVYWDTLYYTLLFIGTPCIIISCFLGHPVLYFNS